MDPWIWVAIGVGVILIAIVGRKKEPPERKTLPPTERQMAYIEMLMSERDVPADLLESDPETISEASALIDALKECPRY